MNTSELMLNTLRTISKKFLMNYIYIHVFFDSKKQIIAPRVLSKNQSIICYCTHSKQDVFLDEINKFSITNVTDIFLNSIQSDNWDKFWGMSFVNLSRFSVQNIEGTTRGWENFLLAHFAGLQRISLENCHLSDIFLKKISLTLISSLKKESLFFSNNTFSQSTWDEFIKLTCSNKIYFNEFSCAYNHITIFRFYGEVFKTSVVFLNISGNRITWEGEIELLEILQKKHFLCLVAYDISFSSYFKAEVEQKYGNKVWGIGKKFKNARTEKIFLDSSNIHELCMENHKNFYTEVFIFDSVGKDIFGKVFENIFAYKYYIEHYFFTLDEWRVFLDLVKNYGERRFSFDCNAFTISGEQLDYLLEKFPIQIHFISLNLSAISDITPFIGRLLKNKAIEYDGKDWHQKLLLKYGNK